MRIEQDEWNQPHCEVWVECVSNVLKSFESSAIVLIGHSLGCATIAHWASKHKLAIKGALLVAPSDVEAPAYHFPTTGFDPLPLEKLSFPSIVVASQNDPWVTLDRAAYFAESWGSKLVNIGNAGHINVASGHGPWPIGLELLRTLD